MFWDMDKWPSRDAAVIPDTPGPQIKREVLASRRVPVAGEVLVIEKVRTVRTVQGYIGGKEADIRSTRVDVCLYLDRFPDDQHRLLIVRGKASISVWGLTQAEEAMVRVMRAIKGVQEERRAGGYTFSFRIPTAKNK